MSARLAAKTKDAMISATLANVNHPTNFVAGTTASQSFESLDQQPRRRRPPREGSGEPPPPYAALFDETPILAPHDENCCCAQ